MLPIVRVIVAAVAVVFGLPASPAVPHWRPAYVLHYLPLTDRSEYDVVVTEPGEAWFFGGSNRPGPGVPEILDWKGSSAPVSEPLPAHLHSWIASASHLSATDIWAVTYLGGDVLHWDGTTWSLEPRGAWRNGTQFTGIAEVSPTDVWLFGAAGKYPGAGAWHWDGSAWTRVTGVADGIYQATAVPGSDPWAIGSAGGSMNALFRLTGGSWRRVRPTALAGFTYNKIVAFGARDVWAAGSIAGQPKLAHFDGRSWTALSVPGTAQPTALCRDGRGGLWVVANGATGPFRLRERSATGSWSTARVSTNSTDRVLACARKPGSVFAVWGAGLASAPTGSAAAVFGYGSVP